MWRSHARGWSVDAGYGLLLIPNNECVPKGTHPTADSTLADFRCRVCALRHARGFERNNVYRPSKFENHATLFMHKAMPSEKKVSDGIGAEARTTRACIPHTPYAWVLDFMQATACYDTDVKKSQGAYRGR